MSSSLSVRAFLVLVDAPGIVSLRPLTCATVFIIIGSFFTLNLFVGAVIDNFNRMRESLEFSGAENETQREWLQIQDMVRR